MTWLRASSTKTTSSLVEKNWQIRKGSREMLISYLRRSIAWWVLAPLLIVYGTDTNGANLDRMNINLSRSVFSDQLTQQGVRQSFQDSRGALWFVTHEGLNRYNGYELQNYRFAASDPNSLPTDNITRITEDHQGSLWLSTRGQGLVLYDPISDSFITYDSDPNDPNTPYSNEISTLYTAADGTIWLGYSDAFSSFNPTNHTFHHYVSGSESLPFTGRIISFTETPNGDIWAATQETGLLRVEASTHQISVHRHHSDDPNSISSNWIWSITTDQAGKIWAASADAGVTHFDPTTNIATNFYHSESDSTSLSSDQTSDIYEDIDGNIWVATTEGLNLYVAKTKSFNRYTVHNSGLPENLVISVYQTREGKYWIGTLSALASGMKTEFQKFDRTQGNLSNDSVNAFAETGDGSLWVGTDNGLNRLKPGMTDFEWIDESTQPSIASPKIMSLFGDGDSLWVGTYENGASKINVLSGESSHYRNVTGDISSIAANGITSILRLSSGELLIGTYGGGLSIYRENGDGFTNLSYDPNDIYTISNNMVLSIFEDSLGLVWVGTEKGLNRFDPKTLGFERFFVERDNPNSFSSDRPMCFFENSDGTLWIGTAGGGLNLWPAEYRAKSIVNIKHFSNNISLPSSNIYGIQGDDSGWVWVSHNLGLTRINPNSLESRQYGVRDGLQAKEFTLGASFRSMDGTVYFGGINGFNAIQPNFLTIDTAPPKVSISQIKVMNERREFTEPYYDLKSIELGYQDSMLSVEFFAADYSNPDLVNYAYKLEGVNPEWVVSPDARIASFTTLPPGTYNLKLAAATPDGTWNWDALSIPVVVAPPPWRSPWAYAAYILLAGALIAYYFYRQAEIRRASQRRQKELEDRVEERTRDLDEARKLAVKATNAKSEFLATMSHEIRTPMHGIIGMTELLLHTRLNGQQKQFALAARNSGESLLNLINEILDFSKVEASKVELEQIGFNLTDLIDAICYLQGEPAQRKGLQLNNICHPHTPAILIGDPTKIRQVVMNLISNSIKFTHSGNINVRVEPRFSPSNTGKAIVDIFVEDDGIGMDPETQTRVFEPFTQADASTTREYGGTGLGLTISRHYIDLMGGDIAIRSAVGDGTKITLSIPMECTLSDGTTRSPFEGYSAKILSSNPCTFQMISSHFERLGVTTSELTRDDLELISDKRAAETIVVVDYDNELPNSDYNEVFQKVNPRLRILLTPLVSETPNSFFSDWTILSKPITSSSLEIALHGCLEKDALSDGAEDGSGKINSLKRHHILVAEDVETNQQIIVEMIRLLGHDVEIANNGEIAVEKYFSGEYSLIFMDCQMPVMDGYSAARKIRALELEKGISPVPIVALTAGSDQQDRNRCEQAGMNGYLTKPFSISDIENSIAESLQNEYLEHPAHREQDAPDIDTVSDTLFDTLFDDDTRRFGSTVIDLRAVNNIRDVERQTGKQLLPAIFEGYIRQMEEKLQEIAHDVRSQDSVSLYRNAHAIKSMSANIGAEKVTAISSVIESRGKENVFSGQTEAIVALKKAYHEFLSEFKIELVKLS